MSEAGPRAIQLTVPSDPGCLTVVRAMVEKMSRLGGFGDGDVERIVMAVDEALANIICHQYGGRCDERIDVAARWGLEEQGVEFVLRDYGPQCDPSVLRDCLGGKLRPGGLGVHVIKDVMDTVEYTAAPGGGMQLRLAKSVAADNRKG